MEQVTDGPDEPVHARLDHELRLIREAIEMIASGGAPRVVVAGVQFGDALLEQARGMARDAGVRVVPLWNADEAGLDLAVERIE